MTNIRKPTCTQAREQIDIVDYLASLNHYPVKINGRDYWYCSPLRDEHTASFKVDRTRQVWFDHGSGIGGDLIKFGTLYHHCTVGDFLEKIAAFIHISPNPVQPVVLEKQTRIADQEQKRNVILEVHPIRLHRLKEYIGERCIPFSIADRYCREVTFSFKGKQYTTLGFQNDLGGYELRNPGYKSSSAPKASTLIRSRADNQTLTVFEGFFNFLSYETLKAQKAIQGPEHTDFLVLNSLSFLKMQWPVMDRYQSVHLFLDRNKSGINATKETLTRGEKFIDRSDFYKTAEDLNKWLTDNNNRSATIQMKQETGLKR